jgi:hypothetical protein
VIPVSVLLQLQGAVKIYSTKLHEEKCVCVCVCVCVAGGGGDDSFALVFSYVMKSGHHHLHLVNARIPSEL